MIATLNRGDHDEKAAKKFLKGLEAQLTKHLAVRDRLFLQLANGF